MFYLEFTTLKDLLASRNVTGKIKGSTESPVKPLTAPCDIEFDVKEGHITSCQIRDHAGHTFFGQDALQIITQLPPLEWEINMLTPSHTHVAITPKRTSNILPEDFRTWPHLYRQIYLSVDGTRDIETLARMFCRTPEQMRHLLEQFRGLLVLVERKQHGN